jgi:REP element-mobilizing transposase RayT
MNTFLKKKFLLPDRVYYPLIRINIKNLNPDNMANKREILVPDGFYHIYNRAIADDKLFTNDLEYYLFLKTFFRYSNLIFNTYGYCLLSNHFHFLIKVRSENDLNYHIGLYKDDKSRSNFLAQHLGNLFNWYATRFNKKHLRKGSLFIHSFQRKSVMDQEYLIQLLCYIHANPVKAGLCKNLGEWKYSSFKEFLNEPKYIPQTIIKQTLDWFDGIDNFKEIHLQYLNSND